MVNFRILAFCLLMSVPYVTKGQCGWRVASSGITTDLKAVHFPNSENGWTVGVNGTVLHSADGGSSWLPQTINTNHTLNSVHFVNNNAGWVVGNRGIIRKTTNGGLNWSNQNSGTVDDLYDVWFSNIDTGWIVGACGLILRTVNGGTQWDRITNGQIANLYQVKMSGGNKGVIATGTAALLNTTNNGSAWLSKAVSPRSFRALDTDLNGKVFVASTNGNVLYSVDGGSNWANAANPTSGGVWQSLSITSSGKVYLAGLNGKLFRSDNTGGTWIAFNNGLGTTDIYGLYMHSDSVGWAVGENGKIFLLKIPAPPVITGPSIVCGTAVTLKATGSYTNWNWSNNQTTPSISVSVATTYTVTATNANGCSATASLALALGPQPIISINSITNATCGQANGQVLLTANTTGIPTYLWSNNTTSRDLLNVPAGSYTVTVTSGAGCTNIANVAVNGSKKPDITPFATDAACDKPNGRIQLDTMNTQGTVTYLWSNNAVTKDLLSIPAGTYTVTVSNANGCSAVSVVIVNGSTAPTASVGSVTDATCDKNNGSININTSKLVGTPTFLWNSGQSDQNLSMVSAGTYTVTITSGNGCTAAISAVVGGTSAPHVNAIVLPASCDLSNGRIKLDTMRTIGNVSYLWSNSATSKDIEDVPAGIYTVMVTNGNGCTVSTTATVDGSVAPNVSLTPFAATCGLSDGAVTVVAFNTIGNVSYLWSNNATTQNISAVGAGTYAVTVTSGNGCTTSASTVINGGIVVNAVITAQPDTCNRSQGSIFLSNIGGVVGTPSFKWSNGSTTQDLIQLAAGTYTLTVTNGNGCTNIFVKDISNVTIAPQIKVIAPLGVCRGESVILEATGGVSYQWNNGVVQNLSFIPIQTQTYTVTVTGQNTCTATATHTVMLWEHPVVQIGGTAVLCMGSAELSVGNGMSYLWSSGQTTSKIIALTPGVYNVTLTDVNGCTGTDSHEVGPDAGSLVPNITGSRNLCNGLAVLDAGNGYGSYKWSNGSSNQRISINSEGAFSVTVTAANGCTGVASVNIDNNFPNPQPVITGPTSFCKGAIILSAQGPYTKWEWSTGQSGPVGSISVNVPNTYSVTVTDVNGCTGTASVPVSITDKTPPTITLSQPSIITVTCSTIPPLAPLPATDDCDISVVTTGLPVQFVSSSTCGTRTLERQWSVQDASGNLTTIKQTIIVQDNTPPIINFNLPPDITVDCGSLPPLQMLTASDDCDSGVNATTMPTEDKSALTMCGTGTIIRTWRAVDCAGNATTVTQRIVLVDTTPPLITSATPADVTINCGEPLPTKAQLTVSDLCDQSLSATNTPIDDVNGLSLCGTGFILRTWTATDCSGNTQTTRQRITVVDNSPPVLMIPPDITLDCALTLPSPLLGVAGTDNCGGTPVIVHVGDTPIVTNTCLILLKRTWRATDCSGNTTLLTQNINFTDDTAPVFEKVPKDSAVCIGTQIAMKSLKWTDNCGGSGFTTGTDVLTDTLLTRTWRQVDACGNVAVAIQKIRILALPIAYAGASQTICAGGLVSLTATGGVNYQWNNGVFQDQPFQPMQTQTYTVTVTSSGGCTATSSVTVTVNQVPSMNPINNVSICAGQTVAPILFTGSPGALFHWTNNNTSIGLPLMGNGDIQSFSPVTPTTVQVADIVVWPVVGTCIGTSKSFRVTVNPKPYMNDINDVKVCGGAEIAPVIFSGAQGTSFIWTNNNTSIGLPSSGIGSLNTLIAPIQVTTQTAILTVTPQIGGCVGDTKNFKIIVHANPQPLIMGKDALCGSDTIVLDAGDIYTTWQWSSGQTTSTIVVSTAGKYTVTVTNTEECYGTASKVINRLTAPNVVILGKKYFCPNSNTILSTDNLYQQYLWSNNSTEPSILVDAAGVYTVTVTNLNGCTGIGRDTIRTYSMPAAQLGFSEGSGIASNDGVVCKGVPVYFTGHGGSLYQFFINGTPLGEENTKPYFETSSLNDGDIISLRIQDTNGCRDLTENGEISPMAPIKMRVRDLPNWIGAQLSLQSSCKDKPVLILIKTPNLADGKYYVVYSLDGANKTSFIQDSILIKDTKSTLNLGTLNSLGSTTFTIRSIKNEYGCERMLDGVNSSLNFLNGSGIKNEIDATICKSSTYFFCGENLNKAGSYECKYLNSQGCDSIVQLKLKIADTIEQKRSIKICEGKPYVFYGQTLTAEGEYNHFQMATNGGCDTLFKLILSYIKLRQISIRDSICNGQIKKIGDKLYYGPGTYFDTLRSQGCDSIIWEIELKKISPLNLANLGPDISLCKPEQLVLNATNGICNACSFIWSESAWKQRSIIINPTYTTDYRVTLTDSKGCSSTDTLRVSILNNQELVAMKDSVVLPISSTLLDIDVLMNDVYQGEVYLKIDKSPNQGKVKFNNDGILQYIPAPNFVGIDTLMYLLCTDTTRCLICKSGTVIIRRSTSIPSEIPNLFFPDQGNTLNGIFDPVGILRLKGDIKATDTVEIVIINRFGEVVVEKDQDDVSWDGTNNSGHDMPSDTYYYVILLNKKRFAAGPITLLRQH